MAFFKVFGMGPKIGSRFFYVLDCHNCVYLFQATRVVLGSLNLLIFDIFMTLHLGVYNIYSKIFNILYIHIQNHNNLNQFKNNCPTTSCNLVYTLPISHWHVFDYTEQARLVPAAHRLSSLAHSERVEKQSSIIHTDLTKIQNSFT